MNFYKHHLGDYDGATTHLSWDEDMAYTRVLRSYYRRERPPVDTAEAYRLVRASSRSQKAAVDAVLNEFFQLEADGWHNKRADEEIAAYQAQASTNRRIAQQRTVKRTVSDDDNEPSHDSSPDRTPNHKPRTKNHKPEETIKPSSSVSEGQTPEAKIAIALRAKNVQVSSQDAYVAGWIRDGITLDALVEATERAWIQQPEAKKFNGGYIDAIVRSPPKRAKVNGNAWRGSNAGIEAKGREIGMHARTGESYQDYAARIATAIEERDGQHTH